MGFGHRVYRAEDPRARVLRRTAQELDAPRYEVAEALEKAALAELQARRPDRVLETNVEFWAAIVLDFAEVPAHMFTSMFTCARTAGWSAHILEQKRTGRLIRPSARVRRPGRARREDVAGWDPLAVTDRLSTARRTAVRRATAIGTAAHDRRSTSSIPADLKPADGRFGSGPSQGPRRGARRAGRDRPTLLGTSHRQAPVQSLVGRRPRRAWPSCSRCPTATRSCSATAASTAFWDVAAFGLIRERSAAPGVRRVLAPSSPGAAGTRRSSASPTVIAGRAGHAAAARSPRTGVDVYAWPHNETSTGVMAPVRRVAGRRRRTRWCVSTPPPAPAGCRSTSRRPTSTTSRRRSASPSDGGLWLALMSPRGARARVEQIAASGRWIPAFLDLADRDRQLAGSTRPTTPRRWRRCSCCAEQVDWLNGQRRAGLGRRAAPRTRRAGSTPGPSKPPYATPFVTDPALRSPVVGDDRLRRRRSTPRAVAKVLRANGIVDTEPYRKLGRNQLRIAMFPAVDPDDVEALTALHRLHRVGDVLAAGASPARKRDRGGGGDQAADEQDRCGQGFVDLGAVGADVGFAPVAGGTTDPPNPVATVASRPAAPGPWSADRR